MRTAAALFVLAMLVLAGCSSPGGSDGDAPFEVAGSPVATSEVHLPRSYRFDPAVIRVDAGTTVTWTNEDDFPHNVQLLDGTDVTEDLPIGESASITFSEPGVVLYQCSIHPQQMRGKVIVE